MSLTKKNVIIFVVVLLTMGSLTLMSYRMYIGDYEEEDLNRLEKTETESTTNIPGDENQDTADNLMSPYTGQEERYIKALSEKDIEGLKSGSGMIFNGMAKAAELNGYPGPRHVLDAHEQGTMELTDLQLEEIQGVFDEMQKDAIKLGAEILKTEQEMDVAFDRDTMSEYKLQRKVSESAELYGQLRFIHLRAHLQVADILSDEQIKQYNELRGYSGRFEQDSDKEDETEKSQHHMHESHQSSGN